ncbi:MAG TPA: hypothetical protein PLN91_03710 [Rhodanobacteraceae bacterium]|nr:hypothetical protein [Rhodanobacteraceae bacterium]
MTSRSPWLRLFFGAMLAMCAAFDAHAQTSAPALATMPSPPPANRPFRATFSFTWFAGAFGVTAGNPITVSGSNITVPFDLGCGFICPGGQSYSAFAFDMPALAAGSYRVRMVDAANPTQLLAEFPLVVGVTDVPASGPVSLMLMILVLFLAATHDRHRRALV